ncbi:hypothetical protein RQP46_007591 [Phenoliferia psychrophenolica]
MSSTTSSDPALHIDDYELTAASLVALLTQHPNITTLSAPNLTLLLDPSTPPPSFTLKKLDTLRANVAPSFLHFLSQLPPSALPKLRQLSLTGRFYKRNFMGPPMNDFPEDVDGFHRTHENVEDFMEVFGPKLDIIEVRALEQITTSDVRSLQRVVPGAEPAFDAESGEFVEDSADWEWNQGAQALVRVN